MNYHVAKNGAQLGQLSEEEIRRRLASGELSASDLCWTDGMAEWQPLGSQFQSPAVFAAPPPPASFNPYAAPASNVLRSPGSQYGLELADRGTRLGAAILEGLIFGLASAPIIAAAVMSEAAVQNGEDPQINILLVAIGSLLLLGLVIYQLIMLGQRGQSIGKRMLGIRIVTHPDGANPGGVKTILLRGLVTGIISNIPFLGALFSIVNICFIFREDRRCIHDLIAGTQVVKGQPPQ
jgi:uncharacterized RDD family membrane protein YckC